MSIITLTLMIIVTFIISLIITRYFTNTTHKLQILDHPNERSLHNAPISRAGGLGICVAVIIVAPFATFLFPSNVNLFVIAIGAMVISIISFIDDRFSLNAGIRLLVHIAVAVMIVNAGYGMFRLNLPLWDWEWPISVGIIISLLYIIWMINLYNFMDGMDGFAGGMTVLGFVIFAIIGFHVGNILFGTLSLIIVAATFGFIIFNFPPAKIFMGDIGSSTLGFLVAVFSLWASRDGIFPLWAAVLVFSPFIVDATITLMHRLLRGERVWEAHKSHYYQRLVQLGWGHRRTVLWEYLLMVLCGISAIVATKIDSTLQWVLLIAWIMIYSILIYYINKLESRHKNCTIIATKS